MSGSHKPRVAYFYDGNGPPVLMLFVDYIAQTPLHHPTPPSSLLLMMEEAYIMKLLSTHSRARG